MQHILRNRLRESEPSLADALERSWTIAHEEWLPALGANMDSFNSYPHLRNLENYLDQVITGFEALPNPQSRFSLRPVEIYLLLAAILFHDIGRLHDNKGHGSLSKKILRDHRGDLGIPSLELAECLGSICEFHEPFPEKDKTKSQLRKNLVKNLKDIVIDPYGEIRMLTLASILTLVDYLDSASTRVLPYYVRPNPNLKPVGAFRNIIRGVSVEPQMQMIRTVIDALADNTYKVSNIVIKPSNKLNVKSLQQYMYFTNNHLFYELPTLFTRYPNNKSEQGLKDIRLYWFIIKGLIEASIHDLNKSWPNRILLSIILNNQNDNCMGLKDVSEHLLRAGYPILTWVVDYKDHLYNQYGEETFEPIFTKDYLINVVKGMWYLSRKIVATSDISYHALAAHVREPDIIKIRYAVKRISIIVEHETISDIDSNIELSPIWYGENTWKWNVIWHRNCHKSKKSHCCISQKSRCESQESLCEFKEPPCKFIEINNILIKINKLFDPILEQ